MRLKYPLGSFKRIRCEQHVAQQTAYWRTRVGQDLICNHHARYLLEGKYYCDRHCGMQLIHLLCKEEKVL